MKAVILISMLCASSLALMTNNKCSPIIIDGESFDVSYVSELCDPSTRSANVTKTNVGISVHYPGYSIDLLCFDISGEQYCDTFDEEDNGLFLVDDDPEVKPVVPVVIDLKPTTFDISLKIRLPIIIFNLGCGILFCFFGLKYYKLVIFLIGFITGAVITAIIMFIFQSFKAVAENESPDYFPVLMYSVIVGIIVGAIFLLLAHCMLFIIGLEFAFILGYVTMSLIFVKLFGMGKTG